MVGGNNGVYSLGSLMRCGRASLSVDDSCLVCSLSSAVAAETTPASKGRYHP